MIEDEPTPRPQPRVASPALASWAVAELLDYIAELRAEIARAEAAITAKQGHRSAADAFFRAPQRTAE